jgi:hypothetical protein
VHAQRAAHRKGKQSGSGFKHRLNQAVGNRQKGRIKIE